MCEHRTVDREEDSARGGAGLTHLLAVLLAAAIVLSLAAAPAMGQTVQLVPFGGQTFSGPYYVTAPPGDPHRVFVVEGNGTIRLVKDGVTLPTPFLTIPAVYTGCNDCGLFSMALAPDYASSGLFYVFYTRDSGLSNGTYYLRIEEYRRSASDPDLAAPASGRVVLEIQHFGSTIHNGGQLQFGSDGLLYASVGDGGPQGDPDGNGQNKSTLLGKLLRINPAGTMPGQYSIPKTNPFAGPTQGADEIYASGLRNPWRFSFDRFTGDLTIGDVGNDSWEEIDFVPKGSGRGANFGWNCFEGTHLTGLPSCASPPADHTPPVLEYEHPATGAAAVTGGYVIRDGALPSLLGRYIYADIYNVFSGELRTAELFSGGSSGDAGLGVSASNVVSFGEDACAHIYVVAIEPPAGEGTVYRLEPTSGPFPCAPQNPPAPPNPPLITPSGNAPQAGGKPQCDVLRKKLRRAKTKRGKRRIHTKLRRLGCPKR
jgi:glucose/arabinose dehydrogenase